MGELHVKEISKSSYMLSLSWILAMSIIKSFAPVIFKINLDITIWEIVLVGFSLIGICSPIIANLIIDKFITHKKEL